jgi:hypothetical protein
MIKQRPSLFNVVRNDYGAFMAFLFPVILWGYFIYTTFAQPPVENTLLYYGLGITAVFVPILLWRIFFFIKIFNTGVETSAMIQEIGFFRGRGRVNYIYTHQDTRYSSSNTIRQTSRTKDISINQEVTVLVDPNNPKRAIIKQLYI